MSADDTSLPSTSARVEKVHRLSLWRAELGVHVQGVAGARWPAEPGIVDPGEEVGWRRPRPALLDVGLAGQRREQGRGLRQRLDDDAAGITGQLRQWP
jgi:hypothetical protein